MIKYLTTKLYFYNLTGIGLYKNRFETGIYNHKQIETYYLLWSEAKIQKMNKQEMNGFMEGHYLYNVIPILNYIIPLYHFTIVHFM